MKKTIFFALAGLVAVVVSFYAFQAPRSDAQATYPDPCAQGGTSCGGDFSPPVTAPNPVPLGGTMQVSGVAEGAPYATTAGVSGIGCDIVSFVAPALSSPVSWTITGGSIVGTVGGTFPLTTTAIGNDGSSSSGPGCPGATYSAYQYSYNFSINMQSYGLGAGSYNLTFTTGDSEGNTINSAPIAFTVLPSGGSGTAGQGITIDSITPNPATDQISVSGNAAGGINTGGLVCQTPGDPLTSPWVTTEQAMQLPATGTYSIDGVSSGNVSLVQTQQGIGKMCPPPQNPAMYTYSFTFSDTTDIAPLSNGSHTLKVCANAGLCASKAFTVQNGASAILQLSTHSLNFTTSSPTSAAIQVTNAGPAASQMSWTAVSNNPSWLAAGPSNNPAPVDGGTSQSVNIIINPAGLSPGPNLGSITFSGASIVDGKPLASQTLTVSAIGAGAAPAGVITVTSENANHPSALVPASWDLSGNVSGGFVCAVYGGILWQGTPCSGTQQTYSGVPNGNDAYDLVGATTTVPGMSLRSIERVPLAEKSPSGIMTSVAFSLDSIFSTVAQALVISPANSQTLTPTTPSAAFILLWTANANMKVSPASVSLTSSPSQTVTIENDGAPYSGLNWTATTSTTGGGNWFDVSSSGGTVTNGASGFSSNTVTISANPSAPNGTYNGTTTINGYDATTDVLVATQTVSVSLTVGAPPTYYSCGSGVCATTATPGATTCDAACGLPGGTAPVVVCTPASITTAQTSSCTLDLGGVPQGPATWTLGPGGTGSIGPSSGVYTPSGPGTVTIVGTLPDGGSGQTPITVTTPPLPTCNNASCEPSCSAPTLGASPSSIVVPESSSLTYGCSNVTQCSLSGGDVNVTNPIPALPTAGTITGSATTTPNITTTYTLTCVNGQYNSDSTSTSVQVTVGGTGRCEQNPNGTGCPGQ